MDNTVKKTIAVAVSAIILGVSVYGSYFPLRKAQMFIDTLQGLQTTPPSSLADLEARIGAPLNYPSPIGQEELVRNTANSVLGLLQQTHDATTTSEIVSFLDTYYAPIINRGKGMSFGQDLYLEGAINEVAFSGTGDPNYLLNAEKFYQEGETLGPNRPQTLYGLFDVYRALGDVTDTVMVANKILMNWPTDTNVPGALQQFLAGQKVGTSAVK